MAAAPPPKRPGAIPVRPAWLIALGAVILLGWGFVAWGTLRAHTARRQAEAARLPVHARATGTIVSLDSLRFSRGEYYYQARYRFATATGRSVQGYHERKGWPPGRGGVWRRDLRVGGAVEVCYAPVRPAQNRALLYATASPCPDAPQGR